MQDEEMAKPPAVRAPDLREHAAEGRLTLEEFEGRMRFRRRVACLMGFGNIDLDLRGAVFASGAFGARQARGNDTPPVAGTLLVRVFTFSRLPASTSGACPRPRPREAGTMSSSVFAPARTPGRCDGGAPHGSAFDRSAGGEDAERAQHRERVT